MPNEPDSGTVRIRVPPEAHSDEDDGFELELPADLQEMASKLTTRQLRYAVHYLVHADKRAACRYAGYSGASLRNTINPYYQTNRPIVGRFMRRVRKYYADLGVWTHVDIRLRLQRVVDGEIEFTDTQKWAMDRLLTLLDKMDSAIAGLEKGLDKLRVEHVFLQPDLPQSHQGPRATIDDYDSAIPELSRP